MFGLHSQPLVIRVLAGTLALAVLAAVLLLCLVGYAFDGGANTPQGWVWVGVGLGACSLTLAFFLRNVRRVAVGGAVVSFAAAVVLGGCSEQQARKEDALLRVGAFEPNMWDYRPVAGNPKLAKLDTPASLALARDNLPRLDGATALYPLYAAFVVATWPALEAQRLEKMVKVSKTPEAYERLFAREADIIFVAKPSKPQLEKATAAGLDLQLTPIGREAFVFYVSSENPVAALTQAQVRGIYAGPVRDWRELGGQPGAIRAFQRPAGSGSQTMLEKIMGDTPLMKAPEQVFEGMGGVVHHTSDYINYPGAIGYSFRVFVARILKAGGIRLLTIDGVAPTEATIADGSYPFAAEFYAATLGPPTGEAKLFIDWMRSPEGQTLVERTGYVPLAGK